MNLIKKRILENWKSGLTVALISVPLSVSLAVASGANPSMGIITAVWAGIFASIFGGSNFNIVGPAGALTGLLMAFSISHGMGAMPMLAIFSGIFILISYILKLERYLVLVPATVMHGFSLGVAFMIGLGQLNFAFGLKDLPKHSEFISNVLTTFSHISEIHLVTFSIFLFFLIALFLLVKLLPKLPAIIAITPLGIILGYLIKTRGYFSGVDTLGDRFSDVSINLFSFPVFSFDSSLLTPALGVAFIAILETLISAKIADNMTNTKFKARKEMLGLSFANIGSGIFGGLPATGVFVRTSLNVKAGATHKISATINAIAVAFICIFFFNYFAYLPMAVIASILVFASIRMIEIKSFVTLWYKARKDFWLAIFTASVMIGVDTVVGLLIGSILALLFFVEKLSKGQFEMTTNNEEKQIMHRYYEEESECFKEKCEVLVYSMKGEFAYMNIEAHTERLEGHCDMFKVIILRMRELAFIDLEGVYAFDHIVSDLQKHGIKVFVSSVTEPVEAELKKGDTFNQLVEKGKVFKNTREVLKFLDFKDKDIWK